MVEKRRDFTMFSRKTYQYVISLNPLQIETPAKKHWYFFGDSTAYLGPFGGCLLGEWGKNCDINCHVLYSLAVLKRHV
jgi:hypothetical protein